jgi:hypothetical protein
MVCAMDVTATLGYVRAELRCHVLSDHERAWQPAVIARDGWLFLVVYDRL